MRVLLRTIGSSYASVLFGSRPLVGWMLAAMTMASPSVGLAGLCSVAAANGTAFVLGYRADAIAAGYYGYNALLLGLAVIQGATFGPTIALLLVLAGAASALLTAVLGDLLHRGAGLPVLALPFVILGTLLPRALATLHVPGPSAASSPVRDGLGALFFQHGAIPGLVVLLAAIAISRIGAVSMLCGIAVARVMAELLSVSSTGVRDAMTFNCALTSMAMGAFLFVPGRGSIAAGLAASALAAWLTVALGAILTPLGVPTLAWPFVLVTLVACRALHLRAPDRAPYPSVPGLTPEQNHDRATALARRFGLPGPPQLLLPVTGRWVVSQGVGGAHTHRGPWSHAWDLEIADGAGFPFSGDGTHLEDYHCYGAPVTSPGAGTVSAVHDGLPDGRPGDVDTARPWGNAVVIQHGPDVHSLLAHLRPGSIRVRPGQVVAAGEHVASCGSSGRSPRPHLHFQAQRAPELGAPAIPIRVVHYELEERGHARYVFAGTPREGDRVARPLSAPSIPDAFAVSLSPGMELLFADSVSGARVRLQSEITLLGDRYLRDLDGTDRLYFTLAHGDLAFTAYDGREGMTPLRALLLALPRLPLSAARTLRFQDRPPAAAMLSSAARCAHDAVRLFVDPVDTLASCEASVEESCLRIVTRTGIGVRGRVRFRYESTVLIGADGLRSLELGRTSPCHAPVPPSRHDRGAGACPPPVPPLVNLTRIWPS
ncbi:MAG: urea transporter [Acidobacteriota bacterium]